MKPELDIQDYLNYNTKTGQFTWVKPRKGIKKDRTAGRIDKNGYRTVCFNYEHFLAHRLAWFYVTGGWPQGDIDHINQDKLDNRFENLRIATVSQNAANCPKRKRNTSGFKGVSWHKKDKKWRATFRATHLGNFTTKELAAEAYNNAAKEMYGDFAALNPL